MIKSMVLLALYATPLLAQSERPAALGDRVRVYAPLAGYRKLTGEVIATTPDVLQLRLDGGPTEVAVQRAQIDMLLLSVSSHRNTAKGLAVGALAGGLLAFQFAPKKQETPFDTGVGRTPTINIVSGAILGAAIGGLAGHYTRTDRWVALSRQP